MTCWRDFIRSGDPYWLDYSTLIERLDSDDFPRASELNGLLNNKTRAASGKPIRFVPASDIGDVNYEAHIYNTGQVSTREGGWHDFFNALVWARFPGIKSAMNASHVHEMSSGCEPGRGKRRDALTLFDECGAIIVASDRGSLENISQRAWPSVFDKQAGAWELRFRLFVIGHAMLEKFLNPYKAMTANALLVQIPQKDFARKRDDLLSMLDDRLAEQLNSGALIRSSNDLSPLPLMGIPGWWPGGLQDALFYNDKKVFRPAPESFHPSPVFPENPVSFHP